MLLLRAEALLEEKNNNRPQSKINILLDLDLIMIVILVLFPATLFGFLESPNDFIKVQGKYNQGII